MPHSVTPRAPHADWSKHVDDSVEVSSLMLATMIPELQEIFENHTAFDMINQLKEMFQQQARTERFETVRSLHACKMEGGGNIRNHVLMIKGHLDHLEFLGSKYPTDLAADIILNSLPKSYEPFIMNHKMNGWEKPISELHQKLKTADKNLPKKTPHVLMIRECGTKKPKAPNSKAKFVKGKGKKVAGTPPTKKKDNVAKEDACFECEVIGH